LLNAIGKNKHFGHADSGFLGFWSWYAD